MKYFNIFVLILLMPHLILGEDPSTIKEIFTRHYVTKEWGCNDEGEGYSGQGSRLEYTEEYRAFLQKFLSDHNIHSVVDLGCGDWTFSKAMDWSNVDYQGFDLVDHVIEKNKKKYEAANIHFNTVNGIEAELPPADLLLCKDVLQHLSNEDIQIFLKKLHQYKYCLITNDINPVTRTSPNSNIRGGDHRYLDLRASPFFLVADEVLAFKSGWNLKQVLLVSSPQAQLVAEPQQDATVLLAILARNKAHVLPSYLNCIDQLEYDKKNISIYINTNNNTDDTENILHTWAKAHEKDYKSIEFDVHNISNLGSDRPHEWTPKRFKTLALIRNKSLQKAIDSNADYYLVIDCDNFVAPNTLSYLIAKNKPIIAPLLKPIPEPNDAYSNYFYAISDNGYYKEHPEYYKILSGEKQGTFEVPVVHCTYLIQKEALPKLSYIDGTEDYEFVIFSKEARKNHIPQFICNEHPFGTLLHFRVDHSLEEEKALFNNSISLIKNWPR